MFRGRSNPFQQETTEKNRRTTFLIYPETQEYIFSAPIILHRIKNI